MVTNFGTESAKLAFSVFIHRTSILKLIGGLQLRCEKLKRDNPSTPSTSGKKFGKLPSSNLPPRVYEARLCTAVVNQSSGLLQ